MGRSASQDSWMAIEDWLTPRTETLSSARTGSEPDIFAKPEQILALRRKRGGAGSNHRSDPVPRRRSAGSAG